MTQDEDDLRDVSRDLPAIDLDPAAAERIARTARRGPPLRRVIEVVLVGALVAGTLVWTVLKVLEALR
ncbi:MAG TPA: hypothetical protein VH143_33220 [Kofleriaceae bacterium]|jgi:hypothetical protein|nr:hypothetical protein [Kofleriaceae bacterium]